MENYKIFIIILNHFLNKIEEKTAINEYFFDAILTGVLSAIQLCQITLINHLNFYHIPNSQLRQAG